MKILFTLCIVIAVTLTVNAQNGKPTKEQTFAFIKDYFVNQKVGWTPEGVDFLLYENNYNIKLEGTVLTVKRDRIYGFSDPPTYKELITEIDLKKVESIGFLKETIKGDMFCKKSLTFYTVNKKEEYSILINDGRDCSRDEDFDKIKKAFNHLRKLFGAPEPISFE